MWLSIFVSTYNSTRVYYWKDIDSIPNKMESHHRDLHRGVTWSGHFCCQQGFICSSAKPGEYNARHFSNRTRSELKLLYRLRLGWQRTEWVALPSLHSWSSNCLVTGKGVEARRSLMRVLGSLDLWDRMLCCFQRCCFTFCKGVWETLSFLIEKDFKASAHLLQWPGTSLFITYE